MNFSNVSKVVCLLAIVVIAAMGCGDKPSDTEEQAVDKGEVEIKSAPENQDPPATPVEPEVQDTSEAKPAEGEKETPNPDAPKPPMEPGETAVAMASDAPKTAVTLGGCLLEKAAARGASRSVAKMEPDPKQDGPQPQQDTVTVTKGEASLTVTHALTHNCCFSAVVKTEIDEHKVKVLETLSGDVCRCMCNSTITTTIDLEGPPFPKQYHVTVEVDNNGTPGTTHEKTIFF